MRQRLIPLAAHSGVSLAGALPREGEASAFFSTKEFFIMDWFYAFPSLTTLIQQLTAPEKNDVACFETLAHAVQDNVLWTVERVTARQKMQYLEPGQSRDSIACFLLKENKGMWGFKATNEAEHPPYYSCPRHFLDMTPEQCPAWRSKVHRHHDQRLLKSAMLPCLAA
jgi:hypothetical protein